MPDLIPVAHDPFNDPPSNLIPVEHDPFDPLAASAGIAPAGPTPYGSAMARGLLDMLAAPGRTAQGQQPQTPGMWSDLDEAQAQANARGLQVWAPQTAMNMVGMGSPFAEVGAAGIFGGRLAKTADQAMLAKAQELAKAGATRDEIWNQTGWFQGPDQKWRFEIPDDQALFRTARAPTTEKTQYDAANQFMAHEKLFTAYPELQDIDTSLYAPKTDAYAGGRYMPAIDRGPKWVPQTEEIELRAATSPQAKSVFLHELQHAIQDREGFAKGANTADYTYQNSPLFQYRKSFETPMEAYHRTAGEVEARNVQRRLFMTPEERAAQPPWTTEDYPHDQQILNMDYAGAQASEPRFGIRAYHGSPYDFERFDLSKIGTGEGAQAYGHGLYFAEHEPVAQAYADTLTRNASWEGKPVYELDNSTLGDGRVTVRGYTKYNPPGGGSTRIERYVPKGIEDEYPSAAAAIADLQKHGRIPDKFSSWLDDSGHTHISSQRPSMYEVSINADPSHFLDWDKPLSEQHPKVQEMFSKHLDRPDVKVLRDYLENVGTKPTGADVYRTLSASVLGEAHQDANAARALRDAGIPGIKYLDQGSRRDYKIFKKGGDQYGVMKPDGTEYPLSFSKENAQAEVDRQNAYAKTHNYVVFDDKLIDIIKKYGLAGLVAGGAAHFSTTPVEHNPYQ